jgi:hypothetical protein
MERKLLGCVGVGVAIVGGMFFAAFLVTLLTGGDGKTEPGVLAGLVVFFGGMLAAGVYIAWRMFHGKPTPRAAAAGAGRPGTGVRSAPPPPQTDAERERRVLRFAEHERGRVTIPEVATRCDMSLADSKATLDRLVLAEVAQIQVTQMGVLVYVFPGFLSDEDKARATDF